MSRKNRLYLIALILVIGGSDSNLFWLSGEAGPADWVSIAAAAQPAVAQPATASVDGMIAFGERTIGFDAQDACCGSTSVSQGGLVRLDLHPSLAGTASCSCCTPLQTHVDTGCATVRL